jgi:aminopeptidase N
MLRGVMRRTRTALAVALVLVACANEQDDGLAHAQPDDEAAASESSPSESPDAGAAGVGDTYFPQLGNGGYDVDHYDLDLRWNPDGRQLDGVVTIEATATQDLSTFNLDFSDIPISKAEVDGKAAETTHEGEHELVVTPADPLDDGDDFTVEITYGGHAQTQGGLLPGLGGWTDDGREVYVASEPAGAHGFFPVNDHPSDKASYSLRITAPADLVVAANGKLEESTDDPAAGTKTWHFEAPEPMASYLVQVVIANLDVQESTSADGVPIRHAIDKDVAVVNGDAMTDTGAMVDYFATIFGPYPFGVYGGVVVDDSLGFALETQTMSLFPAGVDAETVSHELAHQWFGDNVSLERWQDIWLNEGFATYASYLWLEHDGVAEVDDLIEGALSVGPDLDVPPASPGGPDNIFDATVYLRGAATLYVLHQDLGDDKFFEVLRTWGERYGGESATTAEFEELAEEIAGHDLSPLFEAWLRSDELPRLEDWVE